MPLFQEAIYHDRQCIGSGVPQPTSSASFIDITGATLTTTDIGQPATYSLMFTIAAQASLNNTVATFQLLVDAEIEAVRPLTIRTKDQDLGITFVLCVVDVEAGSVFKFQMKTDTGTITLQGWGLSVDGIPTSRIIT